MHIYTRYMYMHITSVRTTQLANVAEMPLRR